MGATRVLLIGLDGFPARVRSPGRTPRLWQLADWAPTVAELLGVALPEPDGHSLLEH